MVCIFRKYEDDVARYYRERKKRELEKSKLIEDEPEDIKGKPESDKSERSITDYIKIEDCYEPGEDVTLEQAKNSKVSGCLLYFLLFVFLAMAIFGFGGVLVSSLRGEKKVFHQKDENTFESSTKEYVEANTDSEGYVSKTVYFDRMYTDDYIWIGERVSSRYGCSSVSVEGFSTDTPVIKEGVGAARVFGNNPFKEINVTFTNEKYENQYYSHSDIEVNEIKRNKTSVTPS